MSITLLCAEKGINGGTIDCAPKPGVAKFLAVWGGKLTAAQLALGYATCKAALIADSKKSKFSSSKLVLFPVIRELTSKKENNTEAKLADGFSQITREGVPAYEMKVVVDMYLAAQLRKLNNEPIHYGFVDDKNLFLGTMNIDGDFLGRAGKLFVDGIDVHGYSQVNGETMIQLQADNAYETFDLAKAIQLDKSPVQLFSQLKDVQLYETATAASNVLKISAKVDSPIATTVLDFYEDYGASAISSNAALWKITNMETGANVTVTGVAPNAGGYIAVTVNSSAYTALAAGDRLFVEFVAPETLAAALVVGIEGVGCIHTKPA